MTNNSPGQGMYIFEKRNTFLQHILPLVKEYYARIAGSQEQVELIYDSHLLHEPFKDLLQRSQGKGSCYCNEPT